MLQNQTST